MVPLHGYEGKYLIDKSGNIFSLMRRRLIKPHTDGRYLKYRLMDHEAFMTSKRVHRLVAQTFIPNPSNLPEVNHLDGNKNNNHVTNLEWCTRAHNQQHAYNTGLQVVDPTQKQGERNPQSKLTGQKVLEVRALSGKMTHREIAQQYNMSQQQVSDIIRRKAWKHIQ